MFFANRTKVDISNIAVTIMEFNAADICSCAVSYSNRIIMAKCAKLTCNENTRWQSSLH